MATLKANSDNSITLPIPLLGICLVAFLAVAGWGATIVRNVSDNNAALAKLEARQAAYEQQIAQLTAATAKTEAAAADYYARSTAQNAAIQETVTNVRIALAAKK